MEESKTSAEQTQLASILLINYNYKLKQAHLLMLISSDVLTFCLSFELINIPMLC